MKKIFPKKFGICVLAIVILFEVGFIYYRTSKFFKTIKKQKELYRKYYFSLDTFTDRIPLWEKYLFKYKNLPNVNALEIGSFEGLSTVWQIENILSHPTSTITCIDIFEGINYENTFDHNMLATGTPEKVIKMKGFSQDVLRTLKFNNYDYIYVDGDHKASATLTDAILSWDLLKKDGLIIFDDYKQNLDKEKEEQPKTAIDSFINCFGSNIEVLHLNTQVIIQKKAEGRKPQGFEFWAKY